MERGSRCGVKSLRRTCVSASSKSGLRKVYAVDIACIAFQSRESDGGSRVPDNISVSRTCAKTQRLIWSYALPSQVRIYRLAISITRVYAWDALWRMYFIGNVYAIARFTYQASFHRLFKRSARSHDRKFSIPVTRAAFGKPHD